MIGSSSIVLYRSDTRFFGGLAYPFPDLRSAVAGLVAFPIWESS